MAKKPTTSRSGRFLKLAGMTASVAGRYASERFQSAFSSDEDKNSRKSKNYQKMANDIADTLGDLKGAVMKIGQIASQTQDLLPKEFSEALQKLQKEAPAVDFCVIKEQVESELGGNINQFFKRFDENAFASASIGQVHKAVTLEGHDVVVKVQYPGVAESCESDLKQLKLTLKLGGLLKLPKKSVNGLFEEIKTRLLEELDYENEARNIELFRRYHQNDKRILIPSVYPALSSGKVLTLELLEGDHLEVLKEKNYTQEQIETLGNNLFSMLADHLFNFRYIHGDPHPGNFAFREDGSIIIYDFGCIKTLQETVVEAYRDAIRASLNEDYELVDDALKRLGARVIDKPSPGANYYQVWRNIFFEPFLNDNYDFELSDIHLKAAQNTPLFFKHLNLFQPPVESIYIDRMISGHFWIVKKMGLKANFRKILDGFI